MTAIEQSQKSYVIEPPRITDNNQGEITVTLGTQRLRSWEYAADTARRSKMRQAREYVEGWCDGRDEILRQLR